MENDDAFEKDIVQFLKEKRGHAWLFQSLLETYGETARNACFDDFIGAFTEATPPLQRHVMLSKKLRALNRIESDTVIKWLAFRMSWYTCNIPETVHIRIVLFSNYVFGLGLFASHDFQKGSQVFRDVYAISSTFSNPLPSWFWLLDGDSSETKWNDNQFSKKNDIKDSEVCVGPYACLVNDSCVPNVEWIFTSTHIVFRALKFIAKGTHIVADYYYQQHPQFRHKKLEERGWLCSCKGKELAPEQPEQPTTFVPQAIPLPATLKFTLLDNVVERAPKLMPNSVGGLCVFKLAAYVRDGSGEHTFQVREQVLNLLKKPSPQMINRAKELIGMQNVSDQFQEKVARSFLHDTFVKLYENEREWGGEQVLWALNELNMSVFVYHQHSAPTQYYCRDPTFLYLHFAKLEGNTYAPISNESYLWFS